MTDGLGGGIASIVDCRAQVVVLPVSGCQNLCQSSHQA